MNKITLAALALGSALFATSAMADGAMAPASGGMAPTNTMAPAGGGMAPTNTMAPMHPATGGMAAHHKPATHPKKPATNAMAPASGGMAPTNTMAPANTMGGSH